MVFPSKILAKALIGSRGKPRERVKSEPVPPGMAPMVISGEIP